MTNTSDTSDTKDEKAVPTCSASSPGWPYVPSAFISGLAKEGLKQEAVKRLQEMWSELCFVRGRLREYHQPAAVGARVPDDVRRYQRLRIIGCAPMNTPELDSGLVMRFTTLDEFLDNDLCAHPSRGEAKPPATTPEQASRQEGREPCPEPKMMGALKFGCENRAQCWEPCGLLGKSEEHARVAPERLHSASGLPGEPLDEWVKCMRIAIDYAAHTEGDEYRTAAINAYHALRKAIQSTPPAADSGRESKILEPKGGLRFAIPKSTTATPPRLQQKYVDLESGEVFWEDVPYVVVEQVP